MYSRIHVAWKDRKSFPWYLVQSIEMLWLNFDDADDDDVNDDQT